MFDRRHESNAAVVPHIRDVPVHVVNEGLAPEYHSANCYNPPHITDSWWPMIRYTIVYRSPRDGKPFITLSNYISGKGLFMSVRIVVLDHDQTLHAQYRTLLEREGYEVVCYASLPDPRTVLLARPDLILLDYFVGTTSYGWIWLITLRTYAEEDIPVLVCTADQQSLQLHAQDLIDLQAEPLRKPFTPNDLIQAVHRHSGRLAQARAAIY